MTKAKVTQHEWGEWFYYDESSPSHLRWNADRWSGQYQSRKIVAAGDVAGSLKQSGYYEVSLNKKRYKNHRVIYELLNGVRLAVDDEIDHLDGDRSNNKIDNLRKVTSAENSRNRKIGVNNTSGIRGVSRSQTTKSNGVTYSYWIAHWRDLNGEQVLKHFSINKLGEESALKLAIEAREYAMKGLVAAGVGYSERHINV